MVQTRFGFDSFYFEICLEFEIFYLGFNVSIFLSKRKNYKINQSLVNYNWGAH